MATHYVSPSGSATWAASVNIGTPATLATANANAVAGDTIYLRGGTYYSNINPVNFGTSGARIIYQAYGSETPTITVDEAGGRWAITLIGKSWIVIDGIKSYESLAFWFIGYGSSYNEIKNCWFDKSGGYLYSTGLITYFNTGFSPGPGSNHNWLHHNTFSKYGAISACDDIGTIRISGGGNDPTEHNTFEDNVFYYGGHDNLDIGGRYNVARRNVFHNEEAYYPDTVGTCNNSPTSGFFGNRAVLLSNEGDKLSTAHHTLLEGNRIGHTGCPPDDDGSFGIETAGCHTIIRYNDVYNTAGSGIYLKAQPAPSPGVALKSGSWSRIYNNSLYHTGFGDADISDGFKDGIEVIGISLPEYYPWPLDVVIKNNIVYDWSHLEFSYTASAAGQITYTNNYNSNPLYVNTSIADAASLTLPDLSLGTGSPCIRAGIPLTQANGSGAGATLLTVDDAYSFQDGTWGSDLSDIQGDWIAIGLPANVVQISSINYATRVITLVSPMTWADNAPIWLYRDSSGNRVLYGNAPEQGAHPWVGDAVGPEELVVSNAAITLASSVVQLSSPTADYNLIVAAASFALSAISPTLAPGGLSPWDIRLGPLGLESTLPALNWPSGSSPEMPVGTTAYIDSVPLASGEVRHNFRTSSPRKWAFEWARLSASDIRGLVNLAAYNEPLHYQNNWIGGTWHWAVVASFDFVPVTGTLTTGTPFYKATLKLEEVI
jgi:hypothetical protein